MAKYDVNKIIKWAQGEVGYIEKMSNAMLDSKYDNPGKNNYTKYGRNRGCNGQAWCDAFVDDGFITVYGKKGAESLLCGFSNYTPTSASYFKQKGLWATQKPRKGDVIFFKNTQRICHTGIVYKVDSKYIYTIEGNTSGGCTVIANGGSVCTKKYPLSYARIAGYGRPNYEWTNTPLIYKGCQGAPVRRMQSILNKKGYSLNADGDWGPKTEEAVRAFQADDVNLDVDGEVGPLTWAALEA